eukprot:3372588-Prorocentrum_lima.AAC.1
MLAGTYSAAVTSVDCTQDPTTLMADEHAMRVPDAVVVLHLVYMVKLWLGFAMQRSSRELAA